MKRQRVAVDLPGLLFEDRFLVRSVDNSKFEKVGRIRGKSSGFDAEIVLDINIDVYPVAEKESLTIALASRLTTNPPPSESIAVHQVCNEAGKEQTLMDSYEYVMYGKIFKLEEKPSERRTIYASFGGLLMALTADNQVVGELELDSRLYILVRKK